MQTSEGAFIHLHHPSRPSRLERIWILFSKKFGRNKPTFSLPSTAVHSTVLLATKELIAHKVNQKSLDDTLVTELTPYQRGLRYDSHQNVYCQFTVHRNYPEMLHTYSVKWGKAVLRTCWRWDWRKATLSVLSVTVPSGTITFLSSTNVNMYARIVENRWRSARKSTSQISHSQPQTHPYRRKTPAYKISTFLLMKFSPLS